MSIPQPTKPLRLPSRVAAALSAAAVLMFLPASSQGAAVVNLDATALSEGELPTWVNSVGTDFTSSDVVPSVTTVAGIKGVTFNGVDHYYTGPSAISLAGNAARTIEAWIYNPELADEETIMSWGTRGGPDGSNCSFNHGLNAAYGAVGHWGSPDMGWDGNLAAARWTYVAYTYSFPMGRVYFDGGLAYEEDIGELVTWDYDTMDTEVPFRIAAQNDADGAVTAGLRGSMTIARIRVHNVALTEQEINAAFASEAAFFGIDDSDSDGMPDWFENRYSFLNPNDASDAALDEDQDTLTNLTEYEGGTDPGNADTDGDGADDGAELSRMAGGVAAPTDPLLPDTDADDVMDGAETDTGTYVNPDDTGTDPLVADTDGDTHTDGEEVFKGSDPTDDTSMPAGASAEALINLDATSLPLGPLPVWANGGIWSGDFVAGDTVPEVTAADGVRSVSLDGAGDFYNGPASPSWVCGAGARTIEAWVHNPDINADEETVFSWGRRGGGDGTNMSFGHGQNATWGAVGHWGGQDIAWLDGGNVPALATNAWTYIVYTYDPTIGAGALGPGTGSLYKDGTVVTNDASVGVLNTWVTDSTGARLPFRVGAQNNADGSATLGLRGVLNIARLRVHDSALSAATVLATYNAELPDFEGGGEIVEIGPISKGATSVTFSWVGPAGATYTVQASSAADSGYSPVATGLTDPTYTADIAAGENRYFRVVTE